VKVARWPRIAALLLSAALIAGCGSTVQNSGGTALAGRAAGSEAGLSGDGLDGTGGSVNGAGPAAEAAGQGASTAATRAVGRGATATSGAVKVPANGAPISVGVLTLKNTNAVPGLSSFHDVPLVYPKRDYEAVINWVNGHGGFGGHQVVPVYYEADVVGVSSGTEEQAECATFTQDNHVAFVLSDRGVSDGVLEECLAKQHVPLIFDFPGYNVRRQFTDFPGFLYAPHATDAETVLWNWVRGLGRSGYFGNGAKVGLLMPEQPRYDAAVNSALKPALASLHLALADTAKYNTADTSALPGQLSGAVLKFKAEGITHALMMDTTGWGVTVLFMQDAQSQAYFPRYAVNSANSPDFLRQNVPAQQLHNAMGISWIPILDVGPDAVPPDNAAAKLCGDIFNAAGLASPDQTTKGVLLWFCGQVLFLKGALDKAAVAPSFQAGVAALGTTWESPRAGGTSFGSGDYTGAETYRVLTFDDQRGYFVFAGGASPMEPVP
jgi:hypothetical protein